MGALPLGCGSRVEPGSPSLSLNIKNNSWRRFPIKRQGPKTPDQVHVSDTSTSTVRAELVEARALLASSPSTSSGRTGLCEQPFDKLRANGSMRAALRQAQGERACLRYVANQAKTPDQVDVSDTSTSTVRAELVEAKALLASSPSTSSGRTGLSEICRQSGKNTENPKVGTFCDFLLPPHFTPLALAAPAPFPHQTAVPLPATTVAPAPLPG